MVSEVAQTSFVIRFFEEFYADVARFKKQVDSEEWTSPEHHKGEASPETTAQVILGALRQKLEEQALQSPRYGGEFAADYYREAEYVMAALADEVFLHMDWAGRTYWEDHILESQIFETHTAGETFFARLQGFLTQRDPMRTDIAHVYLLALGLGFRGRYYGRDDKGAIASFKQQLYVFVYHEDPDLLKGEHPLFPQPYTHTMPHGAGAKLHNFRPWVALFLALFLGMVFASYSVWYRSTSDMDRATKSILIEKERFLRRLV
ncbi:MAG: DotU family type IV/VI secretion system protein [bacterium]|nr:DotU family type IV/VI secretion system protein [bacterium]